MQRDIQQAAAEESRMSMSVSGIAPSTKTAGGTVGASSGLDALREKVKHALRKLERHCEGVDKMEAGFQQILETMKGKLKYEAPTSERRKKIESYLATVTALQEGSNLKAVRERLGQLKAGEADLVLQFTQRMKALLETADRDNKGMAVELEESSKKLTQLMSGMQKLEPGKTIPPSLRSSTGGPNPADLN